MASNNSYLAVDLAAESAVLTAVLTDPEALVELNDRLRPDDFSSAAHRAVFSAVLSCEADGQAADLITIGERLEKSGKLPDTVSPDFLKSLFEQTAEAANLLAHAEVVRDRAAKRRVFQAARSMSEAAGSAQMSGAEAIALAEREMLRLGDHGPGASDLVTVGDSLAELLSDMREADGDDLLGLSTGFHDFDTRVGGLQPGQLFILAARPSVGKTTFVLQMALKMAEASQQRILVLSHEMTHKELSGRLLAMYLNCSLRDLRSGRALAADEDAVLDAIDAISKVQIDLVDKPPKTSAAMRSLVRRQAQREPIAAVIIDYVQMMDDASDIRSRSDTLGTIIYATKDLSKEIGAPFMVLSQLNRGIESRVDRRPNNADLRESGALEQAADIIGFLHRPYVSDPQADPTEAELIITKHRNGDGSGTVPLFWNVQCGRYENKRGGRTSVGAAPPTADLPDEF